MMKSIGVRKEIDKLGRICIPKELRKLYNPENETELLAAQEGILIKNPLYVPVKIEEVGKEQNK